MCVCRREREREMKFYLTCHLLRSAGIGRTGVFIGADIGMRQLEETEEVDILKIVSTLRQDRGGMVQTRDQYLFLHRVRKSVNLLQRSALLVAKLL